MTVLDTSVVVDFLLEDGAAAEARVLLSAEREASAPDLLVFEVIAVLRRAAQRGAVTAERAGAAVADLGDLAIDVLPTLPLRHRAWQLRDNISAGDALFVALAEELGEPLATKDRRLAEAARRYAGIEVIELPAA